jgi:hypothetical protein
LNNVAKRLCEIGDNVDVLEALGRPQISLVLRVRIMLEIVLGVLVVIGFFVFWCVHSSDRFGRNGDSRHRWASRPDCRQRDITSIAGLPTGRG